MTIKEKPGTEAFASDRTFLAAHKPNFVSYYARLRELRRTTTIYLGYGLLHISSDSSPLVHLRKQRRTRSCTKVEILPFHSPPLTERHRHCSHSWVLPGGCYPLLVCIMITIVYLSQCWCSDFPLSGAVAPLGVLTTKSDCLCSSMYFTKFWLF